MATANPVGRGNTMKIKIGLVAVMMCLACTSAIHAQEYGKVRALQQRAQDVIKLRNDFVVHVLNSYAIPHERNPQGAVVRINMEGKWLDITGIEIIPILKQSADKTQQVVAHEIYFSTSNDIVSLTSELTIR